jgi:signal transduction histidine kinase
MSVFSSVRFRLALWNVCVLAVVLALFGYALRYKIAADLEAGVDAALSQSASRAQQSMDYSGSLPPFFMHHELPQGLSRSTAAPSGGFGNAGPVAFAVSRLDLAGHPLDPDHPVWDISSVKKALDGQRVYSTVLLDRVPVRIYTAPIYRGERMMFVLQFARSLEPLNTEVGRVTRGLLTLIPLALLIVGAGALLLTERALLPVRDIAESTERIEAKDLSGRLTVRGHDEFSDLAITINGMLERLDKAFTLLQEGSDKQRRFTADASHELRTPLTIIKANTSLALSTERTGSEYRKTLAAVDRAADRMGKIVQDLLYIARSDAAELFITSEPVKLTSVIDQAVEAVVDGGSHPVTVDVEDGSWISGDEESLVRLFANLLQNAYKYTPATGQISIQSYKDDKVYCVRVVDTGVGIAPEHIEHLGERFFRVDDARARDAGGTGLGLAICHSIVESHGGSLQVVSKLGFGTTVIVTLPATEAPDALRVSSEHSAVRT